MLKTPTKDSKTVEGLEFDLFSGASCEESQDVVDLNTTETELELADAELEELRKLFVGDVDVTEGSCRYLSPFRRVSDNSIPLRPRAPSHRDQTSLRIVPYPIPRGKYTVKRITSLSDASL